MSLTETKEQIENLFDTYTDNRGKINGTRDKELEIFLSKESSEEEEDEAGGVFDLSRYLSGSYSAKLKELVVGDSDKKRFVGELSRIFALLLKTKVDTTEKIKRILKIAIKTAIKIW